MMAGLRALSLISIIVAATIGVGAGAARLRAWRASGVAIWPAAANEAPRRERSAGQFVKRARSRAAGRKKDREPRAREGRVHNLRRIRYVLQATTSTSRKMT